MGNVEHMCNLIESKWSLKIKNLSTFRKTDRKAFTLHGANSWFSFCFSCFVLFTRIEENFLLGRQHGDQH